MSQEPQTQPPNQDHFHYIKALGELIPATVFAKDSHGRYQYVNSLFAQSANLASPGEAIGKLPHEIMPSARAEVAEKEDYRVLKEGTPIVNQENYDMRIGNEHRWNLVSKSPIVDSDGKIMGMIGIALDIDNRKRAEDEARQLAETLKKRNSELEKDLQIAKAIQKLSIGNHNTPSKNSLFEISYSIQQCENLGGDIIKCSETHDGDLILFACDVMGHGVQAGLVSSLIMGLIDQIGREDQEPGQYLTELNKRFIAATGNLDELILANAILMRFSVRNNAIQYANSGYPPFVHHRFEENSTSLSKTEATETNGAIGLLEDTRYETTDASWRSGDLIVLYSDGISEATNADGEILGEKWIRDLAHKNRDCSSTACKNNILQELERASGSQQQDDVSIIVIRCT